MRDVVKVEKATLIKTSIGEYSLSTSIAKKVQEYINSTTLESLDKDNITRLAVSACNHKYKFQQSRIDSG
jgi:hypothetical protein